MPKRRDKIEMNEAETWEFIESQKTAVVATIHKDGTPHVMPLWFAMVDKTLVFETFTKSQKVVNLKRDPRLTVLFEDGLVYDQLKGVHIRAEAELVSDVDRVHHLHLEVLKRNTPEIPEETLDQVSRGMAPKKTAILVKLDNLMTWDHSKLGGIY